MKGKKRELNQSSPPRIVLAYSGGFETTVAIRWLAERYQAEVVTVTLDLGQERDLTDVRERALAAGAVRAHVIDAREELVREYILPALHAGAFDRGGHRLAAALGHSLIARRLIDVARMEGASAVAHGQRAGDARALSRIDHSARALDPSMPVIPAAREWGVTPAEKSEYAGARRIPVPLNDDIADANLWVRVVTRMPPADSWIAQPNSVFTRTRSLTDCPGEPAYVEIEIDAGVPIRANGIEMPILELIESLDIIAGAHGVGRSETVENDRHAKSSEVCEAPAAALLHAAHAALETRVIPSDLTLRKRRLGEFYADLVDRGLWFSPARAASDGFVRELQPRVSGSVRLKLFKGDCRVVGVTASPAPERLDRTAETSSPSEPARVEGAVS